MGREIDFKVTKTKRREARACTNTLIRPFVRRREALRAASKEGLSASSGSGREGA